MSKLLSTKLVSITSPLNRKAVHVDRAPAGQCHTVPCRRALAGEESFKRGAEDYELPRTSDTPVAVNETIPKTAQTDNILLKLARFDLDLHKHVKQQLELMGHRNG